MALGLSGAVTASILLFTPGGLPALSKRKDELVSYKRNLLSMSRQNQALNDEVLRLRGKDPELMESLVRSLGYVEPGERVFVFGDHAVKR